MCGRLNIIDDPLVKAVSASLGIVFSAKTNKDLCPTQKVSVVGMKNNSLCQLELSWGIKPTWTNRIIINAQSESVATKPTFRFAYEHHRVVVPCSGWYEWKGNKARKQKFLFTDHDKAPLYMASIAFVESNELVTLTTQPNQQCSTIHHRMPLLLTENNVKTWLQGKTEHANELLHLPYPRELQIIDTDPLPIQGSLI